MPKRHHYAKPPIAEAIVDITTAEDQRPEPDTSWLSLAEYPVRTPLHVATVEMGMLQPKVGQRLIGYLAESADRCSRLQVRRNGLSIHRLPPYTSWEDQLARLRDYWTAYRSVMGTNQIQRLGVRYINKIDLPTPTTDFSQYVLTMPTIADGINATVSNMFMRLEIPYPDRHATVVLTEAVKGQDEQISLFLDIDAVRGMPVEVEDMWSALESLHELANEIFECSITEVARSLFA